MEELKIELPKEKIEEAINEVMNKVRSDTGMTLKECYEKQIPKKPIIAYKTTYSCEIEFEWECPVCGVNYIESAPCGKWCEYCGQKLDWSE